MKMRVFRFYELDAAEKIYKNGFTGKKIIYHQMYLLCKYLKVIRGYPKPAIKAMVVDYCKKFDPKFTTQKYEKRIDELIDIAMTRHKLENAQPVSITKNELEKIYIIEDCKLQKLVFAMLVLLKTVRNRVYNKNYEAILNYFYYPQIIKMAGLRITKDDFDRYLHELFQLKFAFMYVSDKRKKVSFQIKFLMLDADDQTETAIVVDDFTNVIKFFEPAKKGEK
jgi:hypothetical protein